MTELSIRSIISALTTWRETVPPESPGACESPEDTAYERGARAAYDAALGLLQALEEGVAKELFYQREFEDWASIARTGNVIEHRLKAEVLEAVLGPEREVSGE